MFAVKVSVWAELWVWLSGCGLQELLTAQNCAEAFWVGNLKNRDIRVRTHTIHILLTHSHTHAHTHTQGQEILSQSSQANTTHRDEEEEGDGEVYKCALATNQRCV